MPRVACGDHEYGDWAAERPDCRRCCPSTAAAGTCVRGRTCARVVEQALRLIPDLDVETIESSCCGMAGAFGYGTETYHASLDMAEAALLPAVRSSDAATLIVADGTSCRHQIADGTGRNALHVARVLAMSLDSAEADKRR